MSVCAVRSAHHSASMQAAAKVGEYTPLGDRELKLGADLDFRIRALEEVV